ncbi:MAG: hypothetical protein EXS31_07460 [Pedosphaera sp.]|nr:hypothetical protein [Pedosphaera sp.]
MEDTAKANLNRLVDSWRTRLADSAEMTPHDIAELESHLRDSMAALQELGLSGGEAFLIAARRLGHPDELETAYAMRNSSGAWSARAFWMAAGCLAYLIAVNLGTVGAYLTLWLAQALTQQGFGVGWLGLIARALAFLTVGWFAIVLGPRIGADVQKSFCRRLVEHPLTLLTMLVLAGGGLGALPLN